MVNINGTTLCVEDIDTLKTLYAPRVSKGRALLDSQYSNWTSIINLDLLAMDSSNLDILGQLFGDYYIGFQILLLPLDSNILYSSASCGFTLYDLEQDLRLIDREKVLNRFKVLGDVWRDVICEQRKKKGDT